MKNINFSILILVLSLCTCFYSCSNNEEPEANNENELYEQFVGIWHFSGTTKSEDVITQIQGFIGLYQNQTYNGVQTLYRDGEFHKQETISGNYYITTKEDYFEINFEENEGAIIFDDIKLAFNGYFEKESDYSSYISLYNATSGIISIKEKNSLYEFEIKFEKRNQ